MYNSRIRITSYAQAKEDIILFNILNGMRNGFYIDVGANDPIKLSVSKLFYDIGWRGVNIEPLTDMYERLSKKRKRDINLNIGAGAKDGELEISVDGELSTVVEKFQRDGTKKVKIQIKTLTTIVLENNIKDVHFCKIDVENFEGDVLRGIDFDVLRPWVFCIESAEPGTTVSCYEEWEPLLFEHGYELIGAYTINRYYVDRDKKECLNISNSFDFNQYNIVYDGLKLKNKIMRTVVNLINSAFSRK
jgi:FkbM family methyltransferase